MKENFKHILSRHTEAFKKDADHPEMQSEQYSSLTKKGEQIAVNAAERIASVIERLPEGSVIIFSGSGYAMRTRATLETYADDIIGRFSDKHDFLLQEKDEDTHAFVDRIRDAKDKKAIIKFPTYLKRFSTLPDQWKQWDEFVAEQQITPEEKTGEWLDRNIEPDPTAVAEHFLFDLEREESIARKIFPDRLITFINVSHNEELGALFTYLANGGEITKKGYEKIGGDMAFSEFAELDIQPDGRMVLKYRDAEFVFEPHNHSNEAQ